MVVIIMLGEHAHAHLIEGGIFEAFQRLLHQRVVLVRQGVHRGTEGNEQRAVFIFEMGIDGFNQSMRTVRRFADFRSFGVHRAGNAPMPFPGDFREGENYLTFATAEECIAAVQKLVEDPALLYHMKKNNEAYYRSYLKPEVLVQNSLKMADRLINTAEKKYLKKIKNKA